MPKLVNRSLTDISVRKARPKDKRYDLYDAVLRGFGLRVATVGTKTWFVMRRINGRMVRHSLGRYPELSLAKARQSATEALALMAAGEHPRAESADLFETAMAEWLKRDQGKNRSLRTVRNAMSKHALPAFRGKPINKIRKTNVLRLIDKVVDSGAPVQANRLLAYLRRFFNWCAERDLLATNPTAGIRAPAKEEARERVLSLAELQVVMSAADRIGYPWGPMVKLLALTGQRLKEVANATWDEIDLEKAEWALSGARTKSGQPHLVHLSSDARAEIEKLPRVEGCPWLFSTTGEGPVKGFSKAKKKIDKESGIAGWTFHDLRRSLATHATESLGVNPVIVDKILNHSSGVVRGVAAVYQRGSYLTERRRALEVWGEFLCRDTAPANNVVNLPKR